MEEFLCQDIWCSNENYFPFHGDFLDTWNPVKELTQDTSILLPCIVDNSDNTIEPNAMVKNQQGTIKCYLWTQAST